MERRKATESGEVFRWLLSYLARRKGLAALCYATALLTALLGAAVLPITEVLLAGVSTLRQPEAELARALANARIGGLFRNASPIQAVTIAAGLLITLKVAAGLLSYANQYIVDLVAAVIVVDMRRDMWRRVLRLPDAFFHKTQVGALHSLFTQELASAVTVYSAVFLGPAVMALTLITTAVTVILLHPLLGLCALGTIPLFWLLVGPISTRLKRRLDALRRSLTATSDDIQETLSAVREVKANSAERREEEEWERTITTQFAAARAYQRTNMLATQSMRLLSETLPVAILAIGAFYVLSSRSANAALLVTIYTAVPPLLAAVAATSGLKLTYTSALVHATKIRELLAEPTEGDATSGERELEIPKEWDPGKPVLEFGGVGFTYPDGTYSVRDISFEVYAGQTIAIVGAGGSGKSTVLSILFKSQPYEKGSVRIYGQELRDLSIGSVRRAIGFMTQFPFFFQRSVLENVLYGTDERGPEVDARARELLQLFQLDVVIDDMPDGEQTVVTGRGANFSGSQQKRLALCRALLKSPSFLVLDEPLSGLSPDQGKFVVDKLEEHKDHMVIIMITHDLERLEQVDRLLVFDRVEIAGTKHEYGTVVEQGTFDELSRDGPVFRRLRLQRKTVPPPPASA